MLFLNNIFDILCDIFNTYTSTSSNSIIYFGKYYTQRKILHLDSAKSPQLALST